ncbi:MAG: AAA family ATPase [Candidatus Delongbacteria bacterium]|nr:AAA family ATPase [Candidatus Delongbacteria bacterium]MBN2835548.1 AAA family ATPase [Candidatus Delongbacteria bacterium]
MNLRDKIWEIHDYIATSYYVNHPNMKLGDQIGIDVIIFLLACGVMKKNILLTGNYGLGKTSSAQAVASVLYSLPLEIVKESVVYGHPHLTEEKIVGRLDFSKISSEEKVIFSFFSQIPSIKIIDELNRIPEGTQNMLLNSVESGNFIYLNDSISGDKYPFVATANYRDEGNTDIVPPLLDRFDVSVEVKYPSYFGSAIKETQKNKKLLENKQLAKHLAEIFRSQDDYSNKIEKINLLKDQFSELNSIALNGSELDKIYDVVSIFKFTLKAELLISSFFDYMNSVLKIKGNSRSNHNEKYLFNEIKNNFSVRSSVESIISISKFISFMAGENEVSVDTVLLTLPYVLIHRTEFTDSKISISEDFSADSYMMFRVKKLVTEFYNREFVQNYELIENLYSSLKSADLDNFISKYGASDNPLVKRLKSVYLNVK